MSDESRKLIAGYFARDDIEIISLEVKSEVEETPVDGWININPTGIRTYTITVLDPKLKKTESTDTRSADEIVITQQIGKTLAKEKGMPGVCIWRYGCESTLHMGEVWEFLAKPENQSGTWLIDGGWGGPPGPIHVRFSDGKWENGGFCGRGFT